MNEWLWKLIKMCYDPNTVLRSFYVTKGKKNTIKLWNSDTDLFDPLLGITETIGDKTPTSRAFQSREENSNALDTIWTSTCTKIITDERIGRTPNPYRPLRATWFKQTFLKMHLCYQLGLELQHLVPHPEQSPWKTPFPWLVCGLGWKQMNRIMQISCHHYWD